MKTKARFSRNHPPIALSLRLLSFSVIVLLTIFGLQVAYAQQDDASDKGQNVPPPRIGMVSGNASFWRPGADNWASAQLNTPLAEGDALYTASGATIEVQIGPRAYVRLAQDAMLTLLRNEQRLQQFKLNSGIVAFDVRHLAAGRNIEIDTPAGAFNIASSGYYRMEVNDNATHFIVRRGGDAVVTLADGSSRTIAPSQEAVIETGDGQGEVDTYVAPDTDAWDRWNYARTDELIDAISNRYVAPDVYGTDDLDHYGNWRVTPEYGAVWVPSGMAPDWAPYSTGSWVWDPVYAWTWVDTAPWGWAPYHYGRWVNLNGFWAWCPGPHLRRPAYAPALVAFFHAGGGVQSTLGGPGVSWVALSWGEPVLPWWGHRRNFVGRPWWGGWAGPRVINNTIVNNTVVQHNTVINNIHYRNAEQRNAVIAVSEARFGRGPIVEASRVAPEHRKELRPIIGRQPVRPATASMVPHTTASTTAIVPAQNIISRPVVTLRDVPWRGLASKPPGQQTNRQTDHQTDQPTRDTTRPLVPQVQQGRTITVHPPQTGQTPPWAAFGKNAGPERKEPRHPPEPPRSEEWAARTAPLQQRQELELQQAAKPMAQEAARPARRPDPPSTGQAPHGIPMRREATDREQEQGRHLQQQIQQQQIQQQMQQLRQQQLRQQQQDRATVPTQQRQAAPVPPREVRAQEQQLPLRNEIHPEAPRQLPGQPANQLYQRREIRSEPPRHREPPKQVPDH